MTTQNHDFECPHCGQRLSGTEDHFGKTVRCPKCNTDFVVPSPQRNRPVSLRAIIPTKVQRSPLLNPRIVSIAFFVVTVAGGAFYIVRRGASPATIPPVAATTPGSTVVPSESVVKGSTPPPKLTEDTKSRVLNFIEKGSKLTALTDQGVSFISFSDQLAEVKSVWQTLTLVSWPETWTREKANFESAIEGWDLAKQMWERKNNKPSDPNGT